MTTLFKLVLIVSIAKFSFEQTREEIIQELISYRFGSVAKFEFGDKLLNVDDADWTIYMDTTDNSLKFTFIPMTPTINQYIVVEKKFEINYSRDRISIDQSNKLFIKQDLKELEYEKGCKYK